MLPIKFNVRRNSSIEMLGHDGTLRFKRGILAMTGFQATSTENRKFLIPYFCGSDCLYVFAHTIYYIMLAT